ncbi:hypothetical protein HanIR_Chr11g0557231 [Helianthus annuus]|nr:hypothetical protein HanIR_Chr11g0557231 [Helianthus annuus]
MRRYPMQSVTNMLWLRSLWLLAATHELPPIKTRELVKIALQKLASIPSNNILAVEVLWTPQKENDTPTEQNMLQDYPLWHPL